MVSKYIHRMHSNMLYLALKWSDVPSNSLRAKYAVACSAVQCTLSRASAAVTQLLLGGRMLVR